MKQSPTISKVLIVFYLASRNLSLAKSAVVLIPPFLIKSVLMRLERTHTILP